MADTNERVMAMVQEELAKNPSASASDLQEKATKIDASMGELTTRQFHARYPLQVKRAKAIAAGRPAGGRKKGAAKKRGKPGRPPAKKRGRKAKRAATSTAPASAAKQAGPAAGRRGKGTESVKDVLVDFAGQLAGADTATDLVRVMGDLDTWAERVSKAAG